MTPRIYRLGTASAASGRKRNPLGAAGLPVVIVAALLVALVGVASPHW